MDEEEDDDYDLVWEGFMHGESTGYDPAWDGPCADDMLWVLDDRMRPRRPATLKEWALFMEGDRRQLRSEYHGDVHISTVFLGIDSGLGMGGPPLLYETMAFGGALDMIQRRYASETEAMIGHEQIKAEVLACLRRAKEINTTPHAN